MVPARRSTGLLARLLRDLVPAEPVDSGRRSRIDPETLDSRFPVLLSR
jgi:hypothetical protein